MLPVSEESPKPAHRRIDVRVIPIDQYYFGTLYFTGMRLSSGTSVILPMPFFACWQCSHVAMLTFFLSGSDMFNKGMRQHALDKGFTLNEYSIRPVGATGME